jgi:hypothetical protein
MLYDFSNRVAEVGFNTFDQFEISYLNDFVTYLNETIPDGNFAFYPLRRKQNVGQGRTGVGMGRMGSGNPIIFNSGVTWSQSGVYMDSLNNCGLIDFENLGFQFRRDTSTIFYVFKHERSENEELMFRLGQTTPYFCFDRSDNICADHFTVYAPEFSNDPRRPVGTTYIYDEIFGLDKKGYAVDYSIRPSQLASKNQAYSFYSLANNFVGLNFCSNFDNFSLRSFSGVDNTILTGSFPKPYLVRYEKQLDEQLTGIYTENPNYNPDDTTPIPSEAIPGSLYIDEPESELVKKFLMPSRMVIGAGVSNVGNSYNISGLPQTCAGVLIISGNYCNLSSQINDKLFAALGIKRAPEPFIFQNIENINIAPNITSIIYKDNPYVLDQITESFLFFPNIQKTVYRSIFEFYYESIGVTGLLFAPLEIFYASGNINNISYFPISTAITGTETGIYTVSGIGQINSNIIYGIKESGIHTISGIGQINSNIIYGIKESGIYGVSGASVINFNSINVSETFGVSSSVIIANQYEDIFGVISSGSINDTYEDIFGLTASGSIS